MLGLAHSMDAGFLDDHQSTGPLSRWLHNCTTVGASKL
jgi:hypothetical protein